MRRLPNLPLPLLLALIVICLPAELVADEEVDRVRDLLEWQDRYYPSFIESGEAEAFEQETPDQEEEYEVTPAPYERWQMAEDAPLPVTPSIREPQILVYDLESTATWRQLRDALDPTFEELRMDILANVSPDEIEERVDHIGDMLDALLMMAPFQAPGHEPALEYLHGRISQQLALLERQYADGEFRRLSTTDDLLRMSLAEFHEVTRLSDLDRGYEIILGWEEPADWDPGDFTLPSFAAEIGGWNAARLLAAYENRRAAVTQQLRSRPETWNPILALEMGELARQLARRAEEVPVASRIPFRNAALRLDVLAEALYDYMNDGNYLYARRHARVIARAVNECEGYLKLRELGL